MIDYTEFNVRITSLAQPGGPAFAVNDQNESIFIPRSIATATGLLPGDQARVRVVPNRAEMAHNALWRSIFASKNSPLARGKYTTAPESSTGDQPEPEAGHPTPASNPRLSDAVSAAERTVLKAGADECQVWSVQSLRAEVMHLAPEDMHVELHWEIQRLLQRLLVAGELHCAKIQTGPSARAVKTYYSADPEQLLPWGLPEGEE